MRLSHDSAQLPCDSRVPLAVVLRSAHHPTVPVHQRKDMVVVVVVVWVTDTLPTAGRRSRRLRTACGSHTLPGLLTATAIYPVPVFRLTTTPSLKVLR